jgi:hypothetical protein
MNSFDSVTLFSNMTSLSVSSLHKVHKEPGIIGTIDDERDYNVIVLQSLKSSCS